MNRPLATLAIAEFAIILALVAFSVLRRDPVAPGLPAPSGGSGAPATEAHQALALAGGLRLAPAGHADAAPRDAAAPDTQRRADVTADEEIDVLGLIVWGKVRTRDGGKLPEGGGISFRSLDSPPERGEYGRLRDGAYAVLGLTPGKWKLTCKFNGYAMVEQEVLLDGSSPRTRVDLMLEPASLVRVKILTPDGKQFDQAVTAMQEDAGSFRIGELLVVATVDQPQQNGAMMREGWPGHYNVGQWRAARHYQDRERPLPKDCAGELELREPPPLWVSAVIGPVVLDTKRIEPGQEEVTLTVAPDAVSGLMAKLHVQVVDALSGRPIAGARVSNGFWFGGGGSGGPATDAEGRITLNNLRPGRVWLSVSADGYENAQRQLQIGPAEDLQLGAFPLFHAETIRGTVVDAQGKPAMVYVSATELDAQHPDGSYIPAAQARSDVEGAFTLPRLGRRRYLLRAIDKDAGGVNVVVDATQGAPSDVRLRLLPVHSIRIEKASKAFISLAVRDARNIPVYQLQISSARDFELMLPAGRYQVEVTDAAGTRSTQPLVVGSGNHSLRLP